MHQTLAPDGQTAGALCPFLGDVLHVFLHRDGPSSTGVVTLA
jgi:hypothetical protein